jgi:exosome complex component RRP40
MISNNESGIITVLPGDNVTNVIRSKTPKNLKLGVGLRCTDENVILATCAGRLEQHHKTWFVLQNNKRYMPSSEDRVVGIVQDRAGSDNGGDVYRIYIGGPHPALLSNLEFEGATKRNRPALKPGALVYARITSTALDPILSCKLGPKDVGAPRKDWMTQEGLYGELKGGTLQKIPLGLARELLHPHNCVLNELSQLPFEICIGCNGFLWIHSSQPSYTILVANAILNSQVLTHEQTLGMVQSLIKTVQLQMSNDND